MNNEHWEPEKFKMFKCKKCGCNYDPDEDDDDFDTEMCYICFEESLEEFEEKLRKKIALKNEY